MIAAIGITINDATLKASAKRFFEEWLKFAVWPNGEVFEQHRWDTSPVNPQTGYFYAGTAIGSIVSIADHFARAATLRSMNFPLAKACMAHKADRRVS